MIIRELIGFQPGIGGHSSPSRCVSDQRQQGLCTTFILSDFMDSSGDRSALNDALKIAGNNTIWWASRLRPPRNRASNVGIVRALRDAETGLQRCGEHRLAGRARHHYAASWRGENERIGSRSSTTAYRRMISTGNVVLAELIKLFKRR